ncbi:ATP-binding protein [Aneurinibacillus sp. Ricciae_BoGa-3]|uniref:ATP-binding protein n=1 Tax=Aneurinibacillus sp. Ricciae_BoGa-3 TaxID=3022697 RepID=UPI002340F3E7|nr:ATP-binding protein [Aneurinibacillus sp. Ricciae_BoGa-3]WCK53403.1 ATP-binding protein [Aneurinibacillus sp. Ricciae_BoGa-3]
MSGAKQFITGEMSEKSPKLQNVNKSSKVFIQKLSCELQYEKDQLSFYKETLQQQDCLTFRLQRNFLDSYIFTFSEGKLAQEFGITTQTIYGYTLEQVLPDKEVERVRGCVDRAFAGTETKGSLSFSNRTLQYSLQPVRQAGGIIEVIGTAFDVTFLTDELQAVRNSVDAANSEIVEMEQQIKKSEMLHVLGELAAGIAHEIRNPMTSLKGFVNLLQESIDGFPSYFGIMNSELKRIESIVTDFLSLAKPTVSVFGPTDIRHVLSETIDLMRAQALLYNVEIESDFSDNLPFLNGDKNQLKQVFINLCKNGIESMPNGGKLRIVIQRDGANKVFILIQDEGCGIPLDKLNKLGEPFFTTKNQGTGLGLKVSYKIIKDHQGTIDVRSQEGKGTTFAITLPAQGD